MPSDGAAGFKRHPASFPHPSVPRGLVINRLPPPASHRQPSPVGHRSAHGSTPTGNERWQHRLAIALAALLHGVFVVAIWYAMRPPGTPVTQPQAEEMLQVRFLARAPATAAPPPLQVPPPPKKPLPRRPVEPPAKDAMSVQPPPPEASDASRLYDRHGQPRLPAPAVSTSEPGYVANLPQGDPRVMRHDDPVKYKATRFEQYFPPPGESAGGAAVRRVVDTVVKTTDVRLPGGVHLKCKTVLGIPIPDCINPPPPPSAKDGDERLSMAPARSLDGHAHAEKPPSVEACIAMYRAGKPLEWGCPIDTPNRSVDAERRATKAADDRH